MAEHQVATYSDKPLDESEKQAAFKEHENAYKQFLELTKWSAIVIAVILIALYFIFVN